MLEAAVPNQSQSLCRAPSCPPSHNLRCHFASFPIMSTCKPRCARHLNKQNHRRAFFRFACVYGTGSRSSAFLLLQVGPWHACPRSACSVGSPFRGGQHHCSAPATFTAFHRGALECVGFQRHFKLKNRERFRAIVYVLVLKSEKQTAKSKERVETQKRNAAR